MNHLILTIAVMLCLASCKKEEMPPEELSWEGDWVASLVLRDGVLTEIPSAIEGFPEYTRYITITIEEGDPGFLSGRSFKNDFGMEFQLSPNNQVEFGPVEGTRVQEEEWGGAVIDNIIKTKLHNIDKDSLYFKDIDLSNLVIFTKPK